MTYFVYLIKSISLSKNKTYVGYTNNLNKRLASHNENKGAKSTKGYKWKIIYKKKFNTKKKQCLMNIILKKIEHLEKKS